MQKTYEAIVVNVNDGIADILIDMPLDEEDQPDWDAYHNQHGEHSAPDNLEITAEHWMQEGTRLVITIARHPDDEPVMEVRE